MASRFCSRGMEMPYSFCFQSVHTVLRSPYKEASVTYQEMRDSRETEALQPGQHQVTQQKSDFIYSFKPQQSSQVIAATWRAKVRLAGESCSQGHFDFSSGYDPRV